MVCVCSTERSGHLFIGGSDRPEVACLEMGRFYSVITADSLSYNVTCFPFWIRYPSHHVILFSGFVMSKSRTFESPESQRSGLEL